ncbi:MAG: diphthine synthase [Candidatus Nanoarchaeia archaeon]|nr:diphthine synthase [Candidatus Nanoarchaeia archaeon]
MTLYLIGIGLNDEKDITIRGLETIQKCDEVYLEHYTSILSIGKEKLEKFYQKEIFIADRNLVENDAEEKLLLPAKEKNIALLVVGDIFGATTHTDLQLRAKKLNVEFVPIFNASIINAIGYVGLELYKYGKTTSIVFSQKNWLPHTPYDVIKNNLTSGLHTLCLLDIKVAEPSPEDIRKNLQNPGSSSQLSPPRFMTVNEGLKELLKIEHEQKEKIISEETWVVGVARIGQKDCLIKFGKIKDLLNFDFGKPLHSIIIPGKLHEIEEEMLNSWKI